ncbi:MAG: aminotransferase class V-fold PLP-dependent enzyme [Sphaerochaetaceae bacterium]|nr:aminotransferase class V-fold PLP-dependent enzyme [Sphaerochaetaceae bacterium]
MKRIYLDNGATSFPKAPGIGAVMAKFLEEDCMNPSRTNSDNEFSVFDSMYALRQRLGRWYNCPTPESVCFSSGITQSLNMIIKGLFTKDDHIITSSCEHNSVMRPLVQEGIPFSRVPSTADGYLVINEIEKLIQPNTKALIICAAGNVSGAVQDIKAIADIAKRNNLMLFVDSAQASPFVKLDMSWGITGIAFAGHKGLLGPEGIGGMVLQKDVALKIKPLISGGTGSQSDSEDIPTTLPDRLEAGTQNIPGILALNYSTQYVEDHFEALLANEKAMTKLLYEGLNTIEGIHIVGPSLNKPRTSVISVTCSKMDIATLSALLNERYHIETRVGLHCSPSSHKALGTFPEGTLRFSPGPFTTSDEIQTTIKAIKETLHG